MFPSAEVGGDIDASNGDFVLVASLLVNKMQSCHNFSQTVYFRCVLNLGHFSFLQSSYLFIKMFPNKIGSVTLLSHNLSKIAQRSGFKLRDMENKNVDWRAVGKCEVDCILLLRNHIRLCSFQFKGASISINWSTCRTMICC